ncbi:hypothetical protein JQX13_38240 [Archangium violaceum]|uniref:hypothetical protein n=1 Tax=Archangium violaceum TaxID=83451 RepID=UPI00193BFB87|nr:hypothetical protein [Archangium violaceum]QRK05933.1 hypothetical protein JQX13_38240 [Archangium violaceum]
MSEQSSWKKRGVVVGVAVSVAVQGLTSAQAFYAKAHRNMAEQVARAGGMTNSTLITQLRGEAPWADTTAAEDNVGAYGYDEELNPAYDTGAAIPGANADHWLDITNYDSWALAPDGEAHKVAQKFFDNAKQAFAAGNNTLGWKLVGRGNHYIQDIAQPYHTVFWENADIVNGDAQVEHFAYEKWVDDNWEELNLSSWVRSGAAHAHELQGKTVKEIVVDLARISKAHLKYVKDRKYAANPWATQELMYYAGRAMAAAQAQVVGNRLHF